MKWRTSISKRKDGDLYVREEKLIDLIGKTTFTEAIFLMICGEKPSKEQCELLDAILVISIDHSIEVPSAFVPRVVASTGNSINSALAGGVLTIGDHHGGAVEGAMKVLYSESSAKEIVTEFVAQGKRVPGYGHKIYKDSDPRAIKIGEMFKELGIESKYWKLAVNIQSELETATDKNLPLNIDGAIAAVLCELGFDPIQGKAFFALARFPSMMANIEEELKNEKPYRRLNEEDVEYTEE